MSRKEAKGGKRSPGSGGPAGRTKTDLLIFIGGGKRTRQEILDFARTELKIREPRGIDRHLKELLNEHLLIREEEKKGMDVCYRLDDSFWGFMFIFWYTSEKGRVKELFMTEYCQGMLNVRLLEGVCTVVLFNSVYAAVRMLALEDNERERDMMYQSLNLLAQDPALPFFGNFLNRVKGMDLDQMFGIPPAEGLSTQEITSLRDERIIQIALAKTKAFEIEVNSQPLISYFRQLCFPDDELDEILDIIRCSPTAVALLISFHRKDSNVITMALGTTILRQMMGFIRQPRSGEDAGPDAEELASLLKARVEDNEFKRERPTSLLQMLRAMAMADIFTGNSINGNWVDGFLKNIWNN